MAHKIVHQVAATRRQARRLSFLYALCWVIGAFVVSLLMFGIADYLIHFHDRGIRLLASLGVLLVLARTAYRQLYPAVRRHFSDVEIAQKIEHYFPSLGERLSSSIEFLKQSEEDRTAGSATLRRAVIVETTAAIEQLDMAAVLDRRPMRRALVCLGIILSVALLTIAADPLAARIAVARLSNPLGNDTWPRAHVLAFRDPPQRIATGQTFEVELVDIHGRPLPDIVRIHYLYDLDGQSSEEVEPMHLLNGVMVARKENVARPFLYRAEGGDDQSIEWKTLEVVEPPRIESLKAVLYLPDYTGWPIEQTENNLRALRGTKVAFSAVTTRPLRSVHLCQTEGQAIACKVAANGRGFELEADAAEPFIVDKSGQYWFELEDPQGLIGGQENRWEIQALVDHSPTVNIEQPGGNLFITPMAVVPLTILAKDDLAVREVQLHYGRSTASDAEDEVLPLFTASQTEQTTAGLSGRLSGDSHVIEYLWELATLKLRPGSQVTFFASATDNFPQSGRSTDRRLIVIGTQELEDRLTQRQGLILSELRRALAMQRETRGQIEALVIQLRQVGRLGKQDIDHAQGADLGQRQVTRTLTSQSEGIPAQIKDLLAELTNNRVDNGALARRMQSILAEIDRLDREHLSIVARELTGVIKEAQADSSAKVDKELTSVGQHQDQVIQALEKMLQDLSEWDSYRRFGREVAQLDRMQNELEQAAKLLGTKTLGKEWKDLESQQQSDLQKISKRQSELARQFDKLLQQMHQGGQRLADSDPLPSESIIDAIQLAREHGTGSQMRSASEQLQRNQLGQAGQTQQQVHKDLAEMLDILSNRREHELVRLLKKLRDAELQLTQLRQEQEGLRKKRAELTSADPMASKSADQKRELERLAREERKLQEQLERFTRRLERLQAEQASRNTAAAGVKLGQASAASNQQDLSAAQKQSDLAKADLEEAQRQLAQQRREIEADLALAQIARLQDALQGFQKRQAQALAETERLEEVRATKKDFTRAQMASVRGLAREQRSLETETRRQAEKLAGAEVFTLALDRVAQEMGRATVGLGQGETGSLTQHAQQDALNRLAALLVALKPESPKPPSDKQGGGGSGGQGQPNSGVDASQLIAELKLLKVLQEDINRKFQQESDRVASVDRTARLAQLKIEQRHLAQLALKLSLPSQGNPEDDPEKLPDIHEEPTGDGPRLLEGRD